MPVPSSPQLHCINQESSGECRGLGLAPEALGVAQGGEFFISFPVTLCVVGMRTTVLRGQEAARGQLSTREPWSS